MRLRWIVGALATVMVLAVAASASAQSLPGPVGVPAGTGLNDVINRLLSNNCAELGAPPFGPDLSRLCPQSPAPPSGAGSSSGGSVGSEGSAVSEEQRQLFRRLRQRQQGAASADPANPLGVGVFVSTEYEKFNQDNTRFETGFDQDTVGMSFGADYLFRNGLILGAAFTYAHDFGNYDGVGGGFDHNSYGILAYGSVQPIANMFIDGVAGYTRKDYNFDRRAAIVLTTVSVAGTTHGDTNGNEWKIGLNSGYDFVFGAFTVGPRLGVLYREITMDDFTESGHTGLELAYSNQNIQSLTLRPGVYGSYAFSTSWGVVIPQMTLEYVHEFLDDQRSVQFSFAQDPQNRRFLFRTTPPDRDYLNLGLGVSMVLPQGVQPFLNFRDMLAYQDRSTYTVTLGVRIPF
jgi:outer membrane autotransporter protein